MAQRFVFIFCSKSDYKKRIGLTIFINFVVYK
jgi:hypothetical protein